MAAGHQDGPEAGAFDIAGRVGQAVAVEIAGQRQGGRHAPIQVDPVVVVIRGADARIHANQEGKQQRDGGIFSHDLISGNNLIDSNSVGVQCSVFIKKFYHQLAAAQ